MSTWDEEAPEPTQFAVICPEHGQVFLTVDAYRFQLNHPDTPWRCPKWCAEPADMIGPCGAMSEFDDDNLESYDAASFRDEASSE